MLLSRRNPPRQRGLRPSVWPLCCAPTVVALVAARVVGGHSMLHNQPVKGGREGASMASCSRALRCAVRARAVWQGRAAQCVCGLSNLLPTAVLSLPLTHRKKCTWCRRGGGQRRWTGSASPTGLRAWERRASQPGHDRDTTQERAHASAGMPAHEHVCNALPVLIS